MATMFPLILAFTVVVCLRVPALADSDVANKSETASPSEDIWKRDTLTGNWGCVRKSLEDAGLTLTVNEQSGLWANLTGDKELVALMHLFAQAGLGQAQGLARSHLFRQCLSNPRVRTFRELCRQSAICNQNSPTACSAVNDHPLFCRKKLRSRCRAGKRRQPPGGMALAAALCRTKRMQTRGAAEPLHFRKFEK